MAGKVIDATLQFKDKFTGKMDKAIQKMELQQKSVSKLGNSIVRSGKNLVRKGELLAKGITAPVAAIGVASIKTAADFEAGMSKVQSISGASANEIKQLSDKAKEMGAKTKFSAKESADAFSYMAMAGWKTEDMIDGIEGVMYLAGATGEDLATTSDIVTDALTAFGMKASDTDRFVNVLAKTANNANTNVGLMGETFKYIAPVAGSLGYSIEDTSVAIGIMANNGVKASNAGTAMRSLLTNLAKPGKSAAAAMDKLGISLTDSSGKMKPLGTLMTDLRKSFSGLTQEQKAEYAASIAGKTGMSGLLAIVNASEKDFGALTKAVADSDGAAKKMYDTANDNLNGSLTVLKSTVESIAISIGDKLSPYVKKFVGVLQGWSEKINGLNGNQLDMIIKIAGIAAAIGPMIIVVGKVIKTAGSAVKTIGTIGKTISDVWKGVGLLGKIFKGVGKLIKGGVGLVINAFKLLGLKGMAVIFIIALIAGAAYIVYKNWDKIKAFFIGLGEKFREFGEKVKNAFLSIKNRCVSTVTSLIGKVKDSVERVKSNGGILGAVFQNIGNYVNGVKKTFGGIVTFIKGIFTLNWKTAWQGIVQTFSGIFSTLGSYVKAPINGVIGLINGAIDKINSLSFTVPDWVHGIGGKTFGANLGKIPYLYKGTEFFSGGPAVINDRGAEIVNLPRGTQVIPHDRSLQIAFNRGKQSSGGSFRIEKLADTIIVREDADIDRIAEALAEKLERTRLNMGDVA